MSAELFYSILYFLLYFQLIFFLFLYFLFCIKNYWTSFWTIFNFLVSDDNNNNIHTPHQYLKGQCSNNNIKKKRNIAVDVNRSIKSFFFCCLHPTEYKFRFSDTLCLYFLTKVCYIFFFEIIFLFNQSYFFLYMYVYVLQNIK